MSEWDDVSTPVAANNSWDDVSTPIDNILPDIDKKGSLETPLTNEELHAKGVANPLDVIAAGAGGYLDDFPLTRRVAGMGAGVAADAINGTRNLVSKIQGDPTRQPYFNPFTEGLDAVDQTIDESKKLAPGAYYTGMGSGVVGSIATGLANPAISAIPAAETMGAKALQLGVNAGKSAVIGAGYGADQARSMDELPGNIVKGAVLGGAAPLVVAGGTKVAGALYDGAKTLGAGIMARGTDDLEDAAMALKAPATASYRAMRDNGAIIHDDAMNGILSHVDNSLKDNGIMNPELHKNTISVINQLKDATADGNMSLDSLDQYRQLLGKAVKTGYRTGNEADAQSALVAKSALDDAVDSLTPEHLVSGTPEAIDSLANARDQWSQYKKFDNISDVLTAADGDPNKIKKGLTKFLNNPNKTAGYSDNELAALKSAANTSVPEKLNNALGAFGYDFSKPVSTAVTSAILNGGAAHVLGGPAGFGLGAAGTVAKQLGKYAARGKAEQLLQTFENPLSLRSYSPNIPVQDLSPRLLPAPESSLITDWSGQTRLQSPAERDASILARQRAEQLGMSGDIRQNLDNQHTQALMQQYGGSDLGQAMVANKHRPLQQITNNPVQALNEARAAVRKLNGGN